MTASGPSRRTDPLRYGPNAYLKARAPAARAQRQLFNDEGSVAFKVNYGLKKAERDRAKKEKKEAKARERQAAAIHGGEGQPAETDPDDDDADAAEPVPPPGA